MIYHITHIDNLESIIELGLLCHNDAPTEIDISNMSINDVRKEKKEPFYNRSLHDYVPFFFNPRNPMWFSLKDEYKDNMIILAFDEDELDLDNNVIFTDKNARNNNAEFFNDKYDAMENIDWDLVWSEKSDRDKDMKSAMMAEILILKKIPIKYLKKIYCIGDKIKRTINKNVNLDDIEIIQLKDCFDNILREDVLENKFSI